MGGAVVGDGPASREPNPVVAAGALTEAKAGAGASAGTTEVEPSSDPLVPPVARRSGRGGRFGPPLARGALIDAWGAAGGPGGSTDTEGSLGDGRRLPSSASRGRRPASLDRDVHIIAVLGVPQDPGAVGGGNLRRCPFAIGRARQCRRIGRGLDGRAAPRRLAHTDRADAQEGGEQDRDQCEWGRLTSFAAPGWAVAPEITHRPRRARERRRQRSDLPPRS